MLNGICLLPVIPMRKTKSDKSEMINQILFGETFKILKKTTNWSHVELIHDKYQGWIDNKQYHVTKHSNNDFFISNKKNANIKIKSINQPLILGSLIPKKNALRTELKLSENLSFHKLKPINSWFVKIAKTYLNTPYLWGGRTHLGIDCSGYTQIVYRCFNINLPRDAYQQVEKGKPILNLRNSQIGDLAFFGKSKKITHVGIILDENKIIHASGKVRIDSLDKKGIINIDSKSYSHQLKTIKRVF